MPGCDHLIDMDILERTAPIIRLAAHPIRLRILDYLRRSSELRTVTEITEASGVEQAIVSQQLRILKDQGIVNSRRQGHHVLYCISDFSVLHLLDCINPKKQ